MRNGQTLLSDVALDLKHNKYLKSTRKVEKILRLLFGLLVVSLARCIRNPFLMVYVCR